MVRIDASMWPYGDEFNKYPIGHITIRNTGKPKEEEYHDYEVKVYDCQGAHKDTISLKHFKRDRGIWALLGEVFKNYEEPSTL